MGKLVSLDFEKGLELNFSLKGIGLRISLADNCLFKHNLQLLEVLYNLFFHMNNYFISDKFTFLIPIFL